MATKTQIEIQEDLELRIVECEAVSEHAKTLILEKPDDFSFLPGQHLYVEVEPERGKPFSIVAAPEEDHLQFATVIRDRSDFKQDLDDFEPNDELIVSGPYGEFVLEGEEKIGLIAGGIGITPYMSMLRHIVESGSGIDVVLLHSCTSQARTPFKDELDALDRRHANIKVVTTLTDEEWNGETGRIDADFIGTHAEDAESRTWFASGPPKMVQAMNTMLKNECSVDDVKLDEFDGY